LRLQAKGQRAGGMPKAVKYGIVHKHNKQTASSFSKTWKTTQLFLPTCQVEGC
jgi:hypothetical protein